LAIFQNISGLVIDAIPFLTADDLLFTSEQTYELLQCLQVGYFSK
jgi:hypothetical protein